jgi:2-oxoglutarate dehydrogenase E2 component (dihydrolipoamide succinyltransferase)
MTRLRLRVAERLKGAQNTYAMLTTFNEVDMTGLMEMRSTFKVGLVAHPVAPWGLADQVQTRFSI